MTNSLVWRRVDQPGLEYARLDQEDGNWRLSGTVVVLQGGKPCELRYRVLCDPEWRTLQAQVDGSLGTTSVVVELVNDSALGWLMNGEMCAGIDGCIDVDLAFTPATNTLPIRRLGLQMGERADVAAAWLQFPSLTLQRLDQRYTRIGECTYRYESAGGTFVRELEVDEDGLVLEYPGLWIREVQSG